jgi:hypothetical protein
VDRWTQGCLNPSEVYFCERLTGEVMDRLGYVRHAPRPDWGRVAFYLASWLPRTGLAVLLHWSRTRSPLAAVRRRFGDGG